MGLQDCRSTLCKGLEMVLSNLLFYQAYSTQSNAHFS